MQTPRRITVEVPVLGIGSGPADYQELGEHVFALRKFRSLHLTLLHIGILEEFTRDVTQWTRGFTREESAARTTVEWLRQLPALAGFPGHSNRIIAVGGGHISALEVEVPGHVREYQVGLVKALHELLDQLAVDDIDDFILSSPALGYRHPRWTPHVAIGRPPGRSRGPWDIRSVEIDFGESRIRNGQYLPTF